MASKGLAGPLIRHVAARGYAQAAPAVSEAKLQSTVLPSKTVISALDNGSPVTRVTIAFRAGSRFEPQTELGLSHQLRSAAGLSTGCSSSFILKRKLAQVGATVSATGDREFIYYTLEASQENLQPAVELLGHMVSNQEFRPWELSDNVPRLKYDIAALSPQVRAVDLAHKAAFRRGLGNSLFISPKKIGKISSETLQHFASSTLTPDRCAIAVVGDNLDRASLLAQNLQLPTTGGASSEVSKYHGGEARKEMGGDFAHVVLALQGAPAGSRQALTLAVAAKALGCGPSVKWGSDNSVLAKSVGNIGPFAAAGFNVSYTDTGLFGAVLTVPKDEANSAVKSVAAFLKAPRLSEETVKAAKKQLQLQVLCEAEDGTALAESLAAQALFGSLKTPLDIAKEIDSLTGNDISQVLSTAANSKLSMGAAGNLAFLPYVDEI